MKRSIRTSFFMKSLLLSFVNVVLIGAVLIASGYWIEKNVLIDQLHGQIIKTTQTWAEGIKTEEVQQAISEKSYEGPVQSSLRAYLDKVNQNNPNIAQAYIFGTELEGGNKTSLVAMPTSLMNAFKEGNVNIGDMYEQPQAVASALAKMLKSGKPTFTSFYSDDFGIWTTIAYPLKNADGQIFAYFAADVDASAVPNGLHKLLTNGILILAAFLILIFLLQYFVTRRLIKPLRELIRGIEQVSAGNLNVEVRTGKDEIGIANEKFNGMVRRINEMMAQVQQASHSLNESAKNLYAITERNSEEAETITTSMGEIAASIASQEQAAKDGARAMTEMAVVIQNIAENSSRVADEATVMEEKSLQGNEAVERVANQIGQIEQFVARTGQSVKLLESRSQEIGNIVTIITGLSEQTNLLALNAAIEAARVGEQGKGFAVVAGEVRRLAEQSSGSANQITELIKEIQEEIRNAVEAMEQGTEEVRQGIEIVADTQQLFKEMLEAARHVNTQIQEVSSATEEMSAGTEELSATSVELSASAGMTASSSARIAESIERQKRSMDEVVQSSVGLTSMSEELQRLIQQFKVR
jgi:methyl-accepting chemotaxis protein